MKYTTLRGVTAILCALLNKNCNYRLLKKVIFAAFFTFTTNTLHAQQPALKPLSIGDTVPDMPTGIMINYSKPFASLSDFKNDLVILDFWSTWCIPCIKAMPRFEELQQKFKGRVQFVLTTPEQKEKIEKFLQLKQVSLPCFVGDKNLSLYFPHNSVPHEIWIKQGIVVAITYAEEVTAENIQKILDGSNKGMMVEKKWNRNYDYKLPLLSGNNGGNQEDLLYHSVFTRFLDGIADGGGEMTDDEGRFKIRVMGASIARLYLTAAGYLDKSFRFYNQIVIKVKNKEEIFPSENPQYSPSVRPFFYCYELIVPASEKERAGNFMLDDLNRFFGGVYHIKGGIEKIKTKCWVLRKIGEGPCITSKNMLSKIEQKDGMEIWQNKPFSDFFYSISYINKGQPYPLIDKTGIAGNVDISLPSNVKDIDELRSYLTKYRLRLSLEECEIPMLVIKNI